MKEKLEQIKAEALARIEEAGALEKLNDIRVAYLGKKGELTSVLKGMKDVAPEDRPRVGQMVNDVRALLEERLENGWESTIALIVRGMEEGVIRPVSVPLVKMMLEASLEQFFQRDILIQNQMNYVDALEQVVDILVYGIAAECGDKGCRGDHAD